ncbi:hypothetical protein [Streptomyces racemochromogenes]|uniref:hypothetical protein n=1 Tax=Streptomyces racemochromogenes TaxID=67353 RepID=UPI0031F07E4B
MYTMTLLTSTHAETVDELLALREGDGYRKKSRSNAAALCNLVAYTEPDVSLMAVGMWDEATLCAAFVLERAAPREGWTLDEREEPSLLVSRAYTHPGHSRLARTLTPWVLDLASRLPDPPTAVRCTVQHALLARYLIRSCGWQLVREVETHRGELHLLQHVPRRSDSLRTWIRTAPELTACAVGYIPALPSPGASS